MPNPTEKIYITYKTRMFSEARLIRRAKFFEFLVPWYSFWLLAGSVFQHSQLISSEQSGAFLICLAIGVFGLSVHVGGGRDRQDAAQFKDCYLKLKEIYDTQDEDVSLKMSRYNEVLKFYENQSDQDYDEMLYETKKRGGFVRDSIGYVTINDYIIKKISWKRYARWIINFILFSLPIIFTIILIFVEVGHGGR